MKGLLISIVFCAVLLLLFFIYIYFKKKVKGFIKSINAKKQELAEIISEADEMIHELNRFSDYIVSQMDLKSQELNRNLKQAEEKITAMGDRLNKIGNTATQTSVQQLKSGSAGAVGVSSSSPLSKKAIEAEITEAVAVNGYKCGYATAAANYAKINSISAGGAAKADRKSHAVASSSADTSPSKANRHSEGFSSGIPVKKYDKVIPINKKYAEVIRLSNEGMETLDIAKSLKMGKGEVELVLGLRG